MGVHIQHEHAYQVEAASATVDIDNAHYMVNTTSAAVTLTIDSSLNHFIVFDSHSNFSLNNCTVDFGGGTSKVLSTDGEIVLFYKDGSTWRFNSIGVGNTGAV